MCKHNSKDGLPVNYCDEGCPEGSVGPVRVGWDQANGKLGKLPACGQDLQQRARVAGDAKGAKGYACHGMFVGPDHVIPHVCGGGNWLP